MRKLSFSIFVYFSIILFCSLGTWQIYRLQWKLDLISEIELVHLHVFPYSEREGTPAAKMPQVPHAVRKARATILREAGQNMLHRYLKSCIGRSERVLVEKGSIGRTEHFIPMNIKNSKGPGEIIDATVTSATATELHGSYERRS